MSTAKHSYANPDALVETDWVAAHLDDPAVRLIEADWDLRRYAHGHIAGAVLLDWQADLQSMFTRDVIARDEFEDLLASLGIANDTTVVFYGDRRNVYAASALWLFKIYGHQDCRILNGGRSKWEAEGRPYSQEIPRYPRSAYAAQPADLSIRAFRDQVVAQIYSDAPLVDTRLPDEYASGPVQPSGSRVEGMHRPGRIPKARNVPWIATTDADGTFRTAGQLRALYRAEGVDPDQPVITYSATGESSAHSWFVLRELLGYEDVRNYDGSWAEWGNLVRAPIEHTDAGAAGEPSTSEGAQCA